VKTNRAAGVACEEVRAVGNLCAEVRLKLDERAGAIVPRAGMCFGNRRIVQLRDILYDPEHQIETDKLRSSPHGDIHNSVLPDTGSSESNFSHDGTRQSRDPLRTRRGPSSLSPEATFAIHLPQNAS
jgi:hypothetical protein